MFLVVVVLLVLVLALIVNVILILGYIFYFDYFLFFILNLNVMEVNMLTFNLKRFWLYTKLIFCYQVVHKANILLSNNRI